MAFIAYLNILKQKPCSSQKIFTIRQADYSWDTYLFYTSVKWFEDKLDKSKDLPQQRWLSSTAMPVDIYHHITSCPQTPASHL